MAISQLLSRSDPQRIYLPLVVFFIANSATEFADLVEYIPYLGANRHWLLAADVLSILGSLLLAPTLWFYVYAISSEGQLVLRRSHLWHLLPLGLGLITCLALVLFPYEVRNQVIGDGSGLASTQVTILTTLMLVVISIWLLQCAVYIYAILRRLVRYRLRLKDIYASTERHELRWILWVAILLTGTLCLMLVKMLFDQEQRLGLLSDVFDLALVWSLAHWGLRQQPALSAQATGADLLELQIAANSDSSEKDKKYQRSALGEEQILRIAEKINAVMENDALYLEPDLSLGGLAEAISVVPNYVSQTLNGKMGETFFDYINSWRIEAAKPLISNTDEAILNITYTVGFNSRSSFYKAFKHHVGVTPMQYRNRNR